MMSEWDYTTKKIDVLHGGTPENGKRSPAPSRQRDPIGGHLSPVPVTNR